MRWAAISKKKSIDSMSSACTKMKGKKFSFSWPTCCNKRKGRKEIVQDEKTSSPPRFFFFYFLFTVGSGGGDDNKELTSDTRLPASDVLYSFLCAAFSPFLLISISCLVQHIFSR